MAPEVHCPRCRWRGHPFDAIPAADGTFACPDCGERVEPDEPPSPDTEENQP